MVGFLLHYKRKSKERRASCAYNNRFFQIARNVKERMRKIMSINQSILSQYLASGGKKIGIYCGDVGCKDCVIMGKAGESSKNKYKNAYYIE